MRRIKIGTRKSRLACIQAELVARYIEEYCDGYQADLVKFVTTGDKNLVKRLDEIGGKGLFVKELDEALRRGDTDLSVHSLKDMPMETASDIPILGFSRREDARDVLVLPKGVKEYDYSGPIGSSSNRRSLQLKELYPEAEIMTVRGNVLTRLEKLDKGEYGALVLAAAGLKRLGLSERISRYFTVEEMVPAAGQGILCVQGRSDEAYDFLQGFFNLEAEECARSERAFMAYLNGGCSLPIGVYAEILNERQMKIRGLYYNEAKGAYKKMCITGDRGDPEGLGIALAKELKGQFEKVWLVGAGPGSKDLLTIKAKRLLKEGDCIIYDRLVGQEVLSMIPSDKERIDVGKDVGRHIISQKEISQILVREAKSGKKVVRLKGGDPFLFGRGGEEAEILCREHIPFEVVPGVSSALAVPAYNGIPVTHRDYVSSVHIITGHHRSGKARQIPYEALVRTRGTLVFLMGVGSLEEIMEGLCAAGMNQDMPAAILHQGTAAGQRKLVATVGTLAEKARAEKIKAPSVIVVGEVCKLEEQFKWYESLPLFGKRFIVTRPRERGLELNERLKALGAEVISVPVIQTVPVNERERLEEIEKEIGQLDRYQVLVFTSPYGVERFFEILLEKGKDIRAVSHMKFAVIGKGTSDALLKKGIKAEYMPEHYDGRSLGKLLAEMLENGTKVLLARSSAGGEEILSELKKNRTISFKDLPVYDTVLAEESKNFLRRAVENEETIRVIFTSSSTVEGFCSLLGDFSYGSVQAVCIGEKTEKAAKRVGMQTAAAKNATIEDLIELIMGM